jgi:hypothetical protein
VTLAAAIGGHRNGSNTYWEGWQIESVAIECAIADLMALIRATAGATDNDEYDLRVGIRWAGEHPLKILTKDNFGHPFDGVSTPLYRYTPVETTVNAVGPIPDFHRHVHSLAQDCLNQGGISNTLLIRPPEIEDLAT